MDREHSLVVATSPEGQGLHRLIQRLYRKAAVFGHTRQELAREIGMTYGEFMTFVSGARQLTNLPGSNLRQMAHYLKVPTIAVWLLAGKLSANDFMMPEQDDGAVLLMDGIQRIAQDPMIGPLVPPEAFTAPDSVKALLCALYEDATTQELFPPKRLPLLLQGVQDAAVLLDERAAADDANRIIDGRLH